MAKLCKRPGKIAIFVGNHRYLCQDMCEIRFRSYFRERATDFQVLDAITTFEDSKYAYQSTLDLLHHTPDLVGLFIAGGGKSGVLRGLREDVSGLAKSVNVVGLDLTPEARSGLFDGVIDIILSHPIKLLAETTVDLLASVSAGETNGGTRSAVAAVRYLYAGEFCKSKRDGFGPDDKPSATVGICADGTAGVDVERHSGSGSVCRNWADSVPTGAASGTTAVRAIGGIPRRARSTLPHLGPDP